MDIPRETISGLVRDKKVILPKGYYEKVKNIKQHQTKKVY